MNVSVFACADIEIHILFFRGQKNTYHPTSELIALPLWLPHMARKLRLVVDKRLQFLTVQATPQAAQNDTWASLRRTN